MKATIRTRLINSGFIAAILGAILLTAVQANAADAASSVPPAHEPRAEKALNITCIKQNVGYAINYIVSKAPWWYRSSIMWAWNSFRSSPNPYSGAVLIGLIGPWVPAVVAPCR